MNITITQCDGYTREECTEQATEQTPAGMDYCQSCADKFWEQRYKTNSAYPDSDSAPEWFDPTYAGETW